jgi:uncharacterized integral membrane protein
MTVEPGDRRAPDEPIPTPPPPGPAGGGSSPETRSTPSASDVTPLPGPRPVPSTRVGTVWVALCATAVVFVALIVFLLQNTGRTRVSFLWMEGSAPLAVTLLIAAVGAALITALLGTVRIAQLRRLSRRRTASPR